MTKKQYALDNNMVADGFGGYNIDNLIIKEFGYLLAYITDRKFSDISDFGTIYNNQTVIMQAINNELKQSKLIEESMLNISHELAVRNLVKLKTIIEKICGYMSIPN